MEYIYSALLLHSLGKKPDELSIKKVLEAAGAKPDEGRIKALVAALEKINIEDVLKQPIATVEAKKEEKKEEKKEKVEEKTAEEAVAGLSSLFG
jgi:large subunit ribosomal protein L12